jgi:hypothetical protein
MSKRETKTFCLPRDELTCFFGKNRISGLRRLANYDGCHDGQLERAWNLDQLCHRWLSGSTFARALILACQPFAQESDTSCAFWTQTRISKLSYKYIFRKERRRVLLFKRNIARVT